MPWMMRFPDFSAAVWHFTCYMLSSGFRRDARLDKNFLDMTCRKISMKSIWLPDDLNSSRCGLMVTIAVFLFIASCTVCATIVSGDVTGGSSLKQGGTFVKLTVPYTDSDPANTVGNNTFQKPNLYGFDEGQNIYITVDLAVDILADGSGGEAGSGIVRKGSTVASHYIFFDPLRGTTQKGVISFDSRIIGIITKSRNLAASDFLINTGVTYLNPSARGLESRDKVRITGPRTLEVDWFAGSPGDYIRVLTDFSPAAADRWFRLFEMSNPFHE
jgi:hypothetical protein